MVGGVVLRTGLRSTAFDNGILMVLNKYRGALTRKAVKMMVTWFNDFRIKRCVPIALIFAAAFIFIGGNRHRPPMKSFIQKSAVSLQII